MQWHRLVASAIVAAAASPLVAQTSNLSSSTEPASSDSSTKASAPVVLTPFEVNSTQDKGYFSANTLAGTRLNNNIGDLPSSITVVTMQQMDDTGSTNLNDVFRYEANTEGASTYTPITLVRGNLNDNLGGGGGGSANSFTSAAVSGNRVRGLAAADNEEDNFFSIYRIPFDTYNTHSVEIDRGPNSIIFGTGSPAGIVNQSRTQAIINQKSGEASLSGGSWGAFRQTLSANIPLIEDKLAIYVAQVYNSQGFKQKPASDLTRRQYASFTFDPFKSHKTKITGSFENYSNYASDPNGITPIDFVTPWLNSGRPVYNPINDVITYQATGKTTLPYAIGTTYPNYVAGGPTQALMTTSTSPYFIPSLTFASSGHDIMFMTQGNMDNFYRGQQSGLSIPGWVPSPLTAAQALVNEERISESVNLPTPAQYASWYFPGVTSKSIYDWSTINVNSIDHTWTSSKTYNLDFQQNIFDGLNADFSWFRQELKQTVDSPLSQANATTLYVDTNTNLPNGAVNPHMGQPFVDVYASDVFVTPEINNNFRGTLEYEFNLKNHVPWWLGWLGHHRVMEVFSQHDDVLTNLRYRPGIYGGDANYLPTAAALAAVAGYGYSYSNTAVEQFYYLGGANAANPGQGTSAPGNSARPGFGGPTSYQISTYNYATGQWQQSTLNIASMLYPTGGLSENLQDSKTFFWQSFFFNDRVVGSVGMNGDQVKNRSTVFPATNPNAILYTNGFPNTSYWFNEGPWSYIGGNTSTLGLVVHPLKNWAWIDNAAANGNILAQFARTLSFTFNKSDNFNPPTTFNTDYFGNPLGKPAGKEKDYGLEIATPDNKLFLRATWFNTTNENQLYSPTSQGRANYIDANEVKNWATTVVEIRNGENPSDPNFGNASVYPITAAMQSQISALTGLPYNYGGNVGAQGEYVAPAGTENGVAKGIDLEATYNPLPNWTMKVTWSKQVTTVTGVAAQAAAWIQYRYPTWQKYSAPDLNQIYYSATGNPIYVGNFWTGYGYDSNIQANSTSGWTTTQNYYNLVVASALTVDQANNGGLAPNQREYSWRYLSSYTFDRGFLKHTGIGGALRYDGRATAGYYGNTATTALNSAGQIAAPNLLQPIYTPGRYHLDLFTSYSFKLPWSGGDVRCKVQLNVADVTSNGYLLPVSYNFDGSPGAERIIQPRSYTLKTTFDF